MEAVLWEEIVEWGGGRFVEVWLNRRFFVPACWLWDCSPQAYTHDIFRITLLWVAPYPASSSVPIPSETYEVLLVVVRISVTETESLTWSTLKTLYR